MKDRATSHSFTSITNTNSKKMVRYHSGPFPACFRPPSTTDKHNHSASLPRPPPRPTTSASETATTKPSPSSSSTPNLTTYLYHTRIGLFSLTWSRSLLGRSLHLHLIPNPKHHHHSSSPSSSSSLSPSSLSTASFHLNIKPLLFWNTSGSKKLTFYPDPTNPQNPKTIVLYYDFTRSKFGSGPEPDSGFYIAAVYNKEIALLLGDSEKDAFLKTKARIPAAQPPQSLVVRREHVSGNRLFATKTKIGGKERHILIECSSNSCDPRLVIKIDSKRVLQIKHLKWKFRGSERIEFDGQPIQLSWDAYNWLSEDEATDEYALFTFKFEKKPTGVSSVIDDSSCGGSDVDWSSSDRGEQVRSGGGNNNNNNNNNKDSALWSSSNLYSQDYSNSSCGIEYERKKMKKKKQYLMKSRSPSSSSLSSVSSGCGSVMDWESVEENELKGPTGFSLLVYAWKS